MPLAPSSQLVALAWRRLPCLFSVHVAGRTGRSLGRLWPRNLLLSHFDLVTPMWDVAAVRPVCVFAAEVGLLPALAPGLGTVGISWMSWKP